MIHHEDLKRGIDHSKGQTQDVHRYDDMIYLPHHQSSAHPHMSVLNRAAQFSPFQALSGYEDCIHETARVTENMMAIDENTKDLLDEKLQMAMEQGDGHPELTFTYFVADEHKQGGSYETASGFVKKILQNEEKIILFAEDGIHNGVTIDLNRITDIQGDIFLRMI